jgi:hypothetical protein
MFNCLIINGLASVRSPRNRWFWNLKPPASKIGASSAERFKPGMRMIIIIPAGRMSNELSVNFLPHDDARG